MTHELLAGALLQASGDSLALHPALAAFVQRNISGHVVELMVTPYDLKGATGERWESHDEWRLRLGPAKWAELLAWHPELAGDRKGR